MRGIGKSNNRRRESLHYYSGTTDPLAPASSPPSSSSFLPTIMNGGYGAANKRNNNNIYNKQSSSFHFSTTQTLVLAVVCSFFSAVITNFVSYNNPNNGLLSSSLNLLEFQGFQGGGAGVRRTSQEAGNNVPVATTSRASNRRMKKKEKHHAAVREIERLEEIDRPPSDEVDQELFSVKALQEKKKDGANFDVKEQDALRRHHQHDEDGEEYVSGEEEEDEEGDAAAAAEDDDVYKVTPKSPDNNKATTAEKSIDIEDEEEEDETENDDYAVYRGFKDNNEDPHHPDVEESNEDPDATSDDEFLDDEDEGDNSYNGWEEDDDYHPHVVDDHHQDDEGEEPAIEYGDDDDDEFEYDEEGDDGEEKEEQAVGEWPEIDTSIEKLDPKIKITRNGKLHPEIAWLMSFPNSGTSFTIHMTREATNCTTATNYALEGEVPDLPSVQAIEGPAGKYGPFMELIRDRNTNIPSTILTKTHCIGYCSICGPRKLLFETPRTFMRGCLTGTRGVLMKNATSTTITTNAGPLEAVDVMYSQKLVKKAIHVFRHPLDNIVARFHLEYNEMSAANNHNYTAHFPKNATGFKRWCDRSDLRHDLFESKYIDDDLKHALSQIPCYNEFFKYVQWHNMAFYVSHDMQIKTMILHYHEYSDNFYMARQRVLKFLGLELVSKQKYEFHEGKMYRHYYTREQKIALRHFIKEYATRDTWNELKRYDFEIDSFNNNEGASNEEAA